MQRLSVVIPNYNYGRFIGQAVDSALAVDWPDVEVIVVDDGSTDYSLDVLHGFGDRITVIAQENAGPRVACNRGFAESRGDVVIFLDSDDVLEPSIARAAAEVWRPGISKVQVQMRRVDANGWPAGRVFPTFRSTPSPDQIRQWMNATAAYPTPPGSGNVYARDFLERLFPLDGRCGDATDSACLAAAPYLGDVVTVPKPLVRYRVHGDNRSSLLVDPGRFTQQIQRAYQRHRFAQEVAGQTHDVNQVRLVRSLRRGRHLLQMRVAQRRVCSDRPPLPTDGLGRMVWDSIANIFAPGPESMLHRLVVSAWCLVTLIAPSPVARRLIAWRFTAPCGPSKP
jgi:glycosyltransferase involved in cell wall biosynthesis